MAVHAKITAIGSYVPQRILTNGELERMVETNDEWIVRRTGIQERRIAAKDEYTTDLCAGAVSDMRRRFGVSVADVDLVLVCTHTPDTPFPSAASQLQNRLGIRQAGAVDLNATCAGFPYGLHLADGMIRSGMHRKVLVVAGDTMSKITDYTDRTTCILFGDGAGAVLVERDERDSSFLSFHLDTDGSGGRHVYRSGLSTKIGGTELHASGRVVQNGREVYKWAISTVPEGMAKTLEGSGHPLQAVDWFVPHSANMRMIESICEKSGFPEARTLTSMKNYGNTSAASIPLAMVLGLDEGKIKKGDKLLLYGFGGGLVQAGVLLEWRI